MSEPHPPDSIAVEVTQADIDHGKKQDCQCCPIARALVRLSPELAQKHGVYAGKSFLKFGGVDYDTPWVAELFMGKFDYGYEVSPFTFTADRSEDE